MVADYRRDSANITPAALDSWPPSSTLLQSCQQEHTTDDEPGAHRQPPVLLTQR